MLQQYTSYMRSSGAPGMKHTNFNVSVQIFASHWGLPTITSQGLGRAPLTQSFSSSYLAKNGPWLLNSSFLQKKKVDKIDKSVNLTFLRIWQSWISCDQRSHPSSRAETVRNATGGDHRWGSDQWCISDVQFTNQTKLSVSIWPMSVLATQGTGSNPSLCSSWNESESTRRPR